MATSVASGWRTEPFVEPYGTKVTIGFDNS
ncbi:hypothetical protein HAP32_01639 [Serratia fonticola]|nr:hypothetical protein HAP32_01639 [Serratia fonticola]